MELRRYKINKKISDNAFDFVIAVGGDGTLLKAAQLVANTPVLHVISNVKVNESFFGRATADDFEKKLRQLISGNFKLLKLLRLESSINGKKLPFLALNEVFIGSKLPYHTARYELAVKDKKEEQKSSGVIIATPAGSYAWAKSAGVKPLPLTAQKFLFVVREPYFGRLTKPKLLCGVLNKNESIGVTSHINQGIVAIDSKPKHFSFNEGSKLVVKPSKQHLRLVSW